MKRPMRLSLFTLALALPLTTQADPAALARNCAHCHGLTGVSQGDLIPNLAGQKEAYLKHALADYKQGKRPSLFMGRLAKGYTDPELEAVAAHFARLTWTPREQATDARLVEKGRELAQQRCVACHGGAGKPAAETAPLIAGQWADYLRRELTRYLNPQTPAPDAAMQAALTGLGSEDIEALAQFYASRQ